MSCPAKDAMPVNILRPRDLRGFFFGHMKRQCGGKCISCKGLDPSTFSPGIAHLPGRPADRSLLKWMPRSRRWYRRVLQPERLRPALCAEPSLCAAEQAIDPESVACRLTGGLGERKMRPVESWGMSPQRISFLKYMHRWPAKAWSKFGFG
jgi:hypothetical protein